MFPPMMPPSMPIPGVNPMMRMPSTQTPVNPIAPNRTDSDITLLWVGKIAVGITDDVIRAILSQCGEVVNWRRTTDTKTGQAKNFGFCDFRFPEGALVALKMLNGLVLGDSELWVRVDEKTQLKLKETEERIKKEKSKDDKPAESILTPEEEEGIRKRINDIVSPINKIYQNACEDPDNVEDENLVKEIKLMKARKEREEQENKKREMERKRDMELKRQKIEEEKERQRRKQERDEKEYRRRARDFEDYQSARVRELDRRAKEDARKVELRNKDIEEDNIDDKYRRRKIRATRRDRLIERDMDIEDEEREQEELREKQMRELEEKRRREEEERRRKEEEEKRSMKMEVEKPKTESSQPLKLQLGTTLKPKPTAKVVPSVFGSDLEEEQVKRTKPLITPLIEDETQKVTKAQSILEKIPAEKEKLFKWEIKWDIIDKYNIVQSKIRPYITKKIVEYLGGEEDESMVDYICSRISDRVNPQEIFDELTELMEEEAQVFVPRVWRLLIYEMMLAEEQESSS